jgi:hypothetical protein
MKANSGTSMIRELSKLLEAKTKKVPVLDLVKIVIRNQTNGRLSILRMQNQSRLKDLTRTSDLKLRDLSSLSQRCG